VASAGKDKGVFGAVAAVQADYGISRSLTMPAGNSSRLPGNRVIAGPAHSSALPSGNSGEQAWRLGQIRRANQRQWQELFTAMA